MEKRKFSRVPFNLKAFINCRDVSIKGEVKNLSLKSMLLFTGNDNSIQSDDLVEITIYLSGTANPLDISVRIMGTVVRRERDGIVLQFREMDIDSFAALKNIIAYNAGNEDMVMEEILRH